MASVEVLPVWRIPLCTPVPGVLLPPGAHLCFQVAQLSQATGHFCPLLPGWETSGTLTQHKGQRTGQE